MSRVRGVLLGVMGVSVIGCLGLGGLVGWTFSGMGEVEDGAELPGGATVVKDGYVSLAIVPAGSGKVALVDAGNDPTGEAVFAALAARGLDAEDVSAILLTHGHPDHVAACALFPDATAYAARGELPLLRGEEGSHGPIPRWFGAKASGCAELVGVDDGGSVRLGGREARMFTVPGHTAGSAAWLVDGVLYLGDSADAASSGAMLGAKWVFSDDTSVNEVSLRRLAHQVASEEVGTLVFSHSGTLAAEALTDWAR